MRAGRLKHVIIIQQKSTSQDAAGNAGYSWVDFATEIRAGVWPVSAREQINNMQPEHTITHRVNMRYLAGVKSSMQILHGSRVLEIKQVINVREEGRELDLLCEESDAI